MIAYRVSLTDLEAKIEHAVPGWLTQARTKTAEFRKKKKYQEKSPTWSKVKHVYMEIQGESKCVYCERKMESVALGKGEVDVEHFRPKGNIREWKLPASLSAAGVKLTKPPAKGYYLLPYHPFNYSVACKPCNSALKSDVFPIAGKYKPTGSDPVKLKDEKPYLIYPIGDFDDDPEELISFNGFIPTVAPNARGFSRMRASVTIEFFRLGDFNQRKNLLRERALVISTMYPQLDKADSRVSASHKKASEDFIEGLLDYRSAHANCARSFKRLFERDKKAAELIAQDAMKFVSGRS